MEEAKEILQKVKKVILKHPKRILQTIIIVIFLVMLIFMAGGTYIITVISGIFREDDWSSVPYVAGQLINSVFVNEEGNIENNMSAQEAWDLMLENGSDVDEYLDTPEELARMMKAEIITQFPDIRENPDAEIDWDEVIENPDILQGIIKFKRADNNNNKSSLVYTTPETFQSYIDEYNSTGSEEARKNALSHFTLKKRASTVKMQTENEIEQEQEAETEEDKKERNNEEEQEKETEEKDDESTEKKQTEMIKEVDGDGYSQEYTSSAGITYKHYKQGRTSGASYAGNPYWDGTISSSGCGPTSVAILASGLTNLNYDPGVIAERMNAVATKDKTSSTTLKNQMDSLGMPSEVISGPSAEIIQENLRNGKVMLVSVNNNTRFTGNSHIMTIVDINSEGQVYVCNPSNSGEGWVDVSEITKGCKYIVVTDAGATGIASSSKSDSKYTAVVATWRQVKTEMSSTDDEADVEDGGTEYSMTTTDINYEEMVQPYTMPFEMLWALLVVGEDKNFIFELTDLIYNSEIEITIHDNLTTNTTTEEWHYTKRTKAIVDATITAECEQKKATDTIENDEHDPCQDDEEYVTIKTVETQTNTLDIAITKANVWIVDYQNEYTYSEPTETTTTSKIEQEDEEYPESPTRKGSSYSCKHIDNMKQKLKEKVTDDETKRVSFTEDINVKYYSKNINNYTNITNKTTTQKYIKGEPKTKEKTDEETKPNFVTIFRDRKYQQNKSAILDFDQTFFEIIESNDNTKDMVDTMKYLLYKATGTSYGVEEFDKDRFVPGELASLNPNICGGNVEEKVWFTLRNLGYSEYAVAGVMGNIYGESGFDPTAIEKKTREGHGLCQWSFDRKVNLFSYAASKEKDWTDVDIQIEFLVAELSRVGDAVPFTENQISGEYRTNWENATSVEDATLAFCLGFERCSYKDYLDSKQKRVDAAESYYAQYSGKTWEGSASAVVKEARGAIGVPYVWEGESYTDGMDCSGLVKVCYQRALGVDLPHNAATLMTDNHFTTVDSIDKLEAGGIIVTSSHVGIYSGENTVIHEPQTGDKCKEVPLEDFIRSRPTAIFRNYSGQ